MLNEELLRMSKMLQEAATDLRQCFTVMGQQLDQQSSLLRHGNPTVNHERRKNNDKEKLLMATVEIGSYVGQAVRALQFEDIIQQLISHSRRRAEEIEKMFTALQARINNMQDYESRELVQVLEACHKEIASVKEALTFANPVKQQSLEQGDVTLF